MCEVRKIVKIVGQPNIGPMSPVCPIDKQKRIKNG